MIWVALARKNPVGRLSDARSGSKAASQSAAILHPPRDRDEAQQYLTRAEHAGVDGTLLVGFPAAGTFAIELAPAVALAASLGLALTVVPPAAPDPVPP